MLEQVHLKATVQDIVFENSPVIFLGSREKFFTGIWSTLYTANAKLMVLMILHLPETILAIWTAIIWLSDLTSYEEMCFREDDEELALEGNCPVSRLY